MNRQRWVIIAVFVLLAGLAIFAWFALETLGVGSFELAVHISADKPPKAVSYCSIPQEDSARRVAENRPDANDAEFRPAKPLGGPVFSASIKFTDRANAFGIERAYRFPKYVVLLVEWEDGTKARKLVEVPPGRGDRSVEVRLP